jgi:hypothetical protein
VIPVPTERTVPLENDPALEINQVIAPGGGRRESETENDSLFVHLIEQDRIIAQQHAWPPVRPPPSAIIPLSLHLPPSPVGTKARTSKVTRPVDVWDQANGFAAIVARSFRVRRQTTKEAEKASGKKERLPSPEELVSIPRLRLSTDRQILLPAVVQTARAPRRIPRRSPLLGTEELGSVLQVNNLEGPTIPGAAVARQPERVLRISVAPPVLPPL